MSRKFGIYLPRPIYCFWLHSEPFCFRQEETRGWPIVSALKNGLRNTSENQAGERKMIYVTSGRRKRPMQKSCERSRGRQMRRLKWGKWGKARDTDPQSKKNDTYASNVTTETWLTRCSRYIAHILVLNPDDLPHSLDSSCKQETKIGRFCSV